MNVQTGQQLLTIVPVNDVWITGISKRRSFGIFDRPRVEIAVDSKGGCTGVTSTAWPQQGRSSACCRPENATGNYVKVVAASPVKIVLEPGENRDGSSPGMNVVPTVYIEWNAGAPRETRPRSRSTRHRGPWLVAVVVAMAAFMEILDTSIANVALPAYRRQSGHQQ